VEVKGMGKRIIAALLCSIMLCGIMQGALPEVKAEEQWDAFKVTLTTNDLLQAGNDVTFNLAIENIMQEELTTTWINHFFYLDAFNSETYPGVSFGTIYDENGKIVSNGMETSGANEVFAPGETKNYTLKGTIPDTWGEKSQITVVVNSKSKENSDIYFGQCDYPVQDPSVVPGDLICFDVSLNLPFDIYKMEKGKTYPFSITVKNASNTDATNVLLEMFLDYYTSSPDTTASTSDVLSRADFEGQTGGPGNYIVSSIKAGQAVTVSGTIKVPDNAAVNNKVDIFNIYRIATSASIKNENGEWTIFGGQAHRVTLVEDFTNVNENTTGDAAGNVNFGSSQDLFSYLFTPDELNSGNQLDVTWTVKNCSIDNIPSQDKAVIENKAGMKKIAMLLDIELWTMVNGASDKQITDLPSNLARTITINIPEEYRANNRVFTVIRVHNGAADELPDLDNDPNTVTISTDKFSYYALAYEEQKPGAETRPGSGTKPAFRTKPVAAATGDTADVKASFIICVLMSGVIAAMIMFKKKKMV